MPATVPLQEMTVAEKLQLMEALWADLSRAEAVSSPGWHREVLEQREERIRCGEAQFVDWDQAKSDIRRRMSS